MHMYLAITPGDPSGIGPEVAVRALERWKRKDICPVLYGPKRIWETSFERAGFRPRCEIVSLPFPASAPPPCAEPSAWGGAIAMQSIGLIGETLILRALPLEHAILRDSILRFIIFDGGGLVALIAAAWITKSKSLH